MTHEKFLWCEKYRPQTLEECILPDELKATFQSILEQKDVPNMLLAGPPGCGKTTVPKAICQQLNLEMMFINGSDESGIDVLRTKIKTFASSVSMLGGRKVVILDEADYLNANSTQPALRAFIEEFSDNCSFILTCNFKDKIIKPLHSRCTVLEFTVPQDERKNIAKQMFLRLKEILRKENVPHNDKVLSQVLLNYFPDFRRLINEIQRFATTHGEINEGILSINSNVDMAKLIDILKSRKYNDLRQWAVESLANNDATMIYKQVYDAAWKHMKPDSIPPLVLLVNDYSYKNAFVQDPEVCLMAFLTEVLASCELR